MDQNEREGDKLDQLSLKVIDELKNKIEDLESKIDELILENTELKIKVARMEERLLKDVTKSCLLYTSPSPRDVEESRMPSSA